MGLENLEIENDESLSEIVNQIDELGISVEKGKVAVDTIKSLNETQLTNIIEKSFKVEENGEQLWLTYSEMKKNKFYPFMVQATIDLLSNHLGNKKIDINGTEDIENGQTLDDWIKECGGIDNIYGSGTKNVVLIIQKYYGLKEDGFAGPQFFAKICSVFKGEKYVTNFKVKKYEDENKNYPYGFESNHLKKNNTESKEISGYKIELNDGITIGEYEDGIGYKLSIPGIEGDFYAYKGKKDNKETILFGHPQKNSGIGKYIAVERDEGVIIVKLKEGNKIDSTDNPESNKASIENNTSVDNVEDNTSSESVENNATKINDNLYNALINEAKITLNNYIVLSNTSNGGFGGGSNLNPIFEVRKYIDDGTSISHKFNFHNFITENGKKLDREKLKTSVESEMNRLTEEYKEKKEILSFIRGKTYTTQEIFGDEYDKDNLAIKAFLSKFTNNKVEIDKDTKIEGDTLMLEFDIKGRNKKSEWTIQKIELQDIRNSEGKLDTQLLNKKLVEIINEIINNYFSD